MLCILVFRKFDTKNVQMNFLPKNKNGLPKRHASKAHISSDFQDLGCEKFFYQYGDLHFNNMYVLVAQIPFKLLMQYIGNTLVDEVNHFHRSIDDTQFFNGL